MNLFLLCLSLIVCKLFAAGQVTHVYFAEKYLQHHPEWDAHAFMRGTLFPDIRHLAHLSRGATHQKGTYESIARAPNSFEAGVRFHWYVDTQAYDYYVDRHQYTFLESSDLNQLFSHLTPYSAPLVLKLAHDEILLKNIDAGSVLPYLDGIAQSKRELAIESDVLQTWHAALQRTLKNAPSKHLEALLPVHRLSDKEIENVKRAIAICANHPVLQTYLRQIHDAIEKYD